MSDPSVKRESRDRLWTPQFVLIIAAVLACSIAVQGLNTGTTAYVESKGGLSLLSGALAAVFSIAAGGFRLLFGPMVDSRGRAVIMRVGVLLLASGTLLPGVLQGAAWSLFVGRALQGAGFAALSTAAAAAAADVLPESRLSEGIGYYGLGQAISTSVGPAFGLFLVSTNPAENLFFVLFGVCFFTAFLSYRCRYEKDPSKLPETSAYRMRAEGKIEPDEFSAANKGLRKFFEARALPGSLPQAVMSACYGFGVFFCWCVWRKSWH